MAEVDALERALRRRNYRSFTSGDIRAMQQEIFRLRAERDDRASPRRVLDAYKITAECRKCAFGDGRHYPGCPNEGVGFPVVLLAPGAPQEDHHVVTAAERGK